MKKFLIGLLIVAVLFGGYVLAETTISQTNVGLADISARINANRGRLNRGAFEINQAVADLGAMPTAYTQLLADIDTELTNAPSDAAWQARKAEKDLLVAEFQALKITADAMKAALDAL